MTIETASFPQIKNLMEMTRRMGAIILEDQWREAGLTKAHASDIISASIERDQERVISLIQALLPEWAPDSKEAAPAKSKAKGEKPGPDPATTTGQDNEDSEKAKAEILDMLGILNPNALEKIKSRLDRIKGEDRVIEIPVPAEMPTFNPAKSDYVKPAIFDEVCNATQVNDVFLNGPKGTGKSRMAAEIAKARELPLLLTVVFNSGTKAATMFETHELKGGDTVYSLTALGLALQQPGVILIDEIFAAPAKEVIGLNSILEQGQRNFATKGHGTIERHPDNIIIATSNISGRAVSRQYQGQQQPDASTLGRFITFEIGYDHSIEEKILTDGGLEKDKAKALCRMMNSLRKDIANAQIQHDIGPRELKAAARLLTVGFSLERAFSVAFMETLSNAERAKVNVAYVAS